VSAIPTAVVPPPVAERPPPRSWPGAQWLVLGCYLLGAVAVTWRLWAHPAGLMPAGNSEDNNLFAWCMRYSATAIAHGHLPALVTTAMGAPRGVNLMWNTSFLLPGILLAPVTLLAGPQVSLTIVLTVGIAGSAASLFWVLRRWGASITGAALGGAVYGFSPALLNSGIGHYNLQFAVLPPLIIDAILRIAAGRGHAVRNGAWLGLLAAAQIFIGEELLADTALAALVLVAVLAASHPRAVAARARSATLGVVTAAAVVLLISWYPLWVQFAGPLREHNVLTGAWSGNLAFFVDPSGNLLFHTPASAAVVAHFNLGLTEVLAYLGWPLIVVLVIATIRFWRDVRVRAAAVTCAVLELCSLGGGGLPIGGFRWPGSVMPYHWLQGLPVLAQLIPDRFCILGAGAAGAVLAFSLDLAQAAAPLARGWRRGVPVAVAVLAVLPLVPLPYQARPVPQPPVGWRVAFDRLRLAPDARVLIVPVSLLGATAAMRWQADTGEPGSMIGGYFLAPSNAGEAVFSIGPTRFAAEYLNELWAGRDGVPLSDDASVRAVAVQSAAVRSALAYWRPAAVVTPTRENSRIAQFLIGLFGQPSFRDGRVLAWRLRAGEPDVLRRTEPNR
jgi:hypothetical protein